MLIKGARDAAGERRLDGALAAALRIGGPIRMATTHSFFDGD